MKILQVMAGAKHGGAETAFVDMCIAMHEAGEHIEVITRANPLRVPRLQEAGIVVHIVPFAGKLDVYSRWRVHQIIKKFQPAIVQTWMSRASENTPRWSKSMGVPRYVTVARLGSYYKLKNFKSSEYFVGIAPLICDYLVENGIEKERVTHINNFAETEKNFKPVQRIDLNTPEGVPLVLALGRLHEVKAFDTLIKAVHKVEGVHLWIAGEGPKRAMLEGLIDKLEVGNRVKLLGWRGDRAALFAAADLCVFSSRFEPFGTVFVQAWANKTPLVTTAADGPRQFVRNGEDALMVPVDDVDALAGAIQQIISDKGLCEKMIANGWKRYQDEFTKEQCLQKYLGWYHSIREREGL